MRSQYHYQSLQHALPTLMPFLVALPPNSLVNVEALKRGQVVLRVGPWLPKPSISP